VSSALTELGAALQGRLRDEVGGQILQELLSRSHGHRDEFVRAVGGVLRVDDLGQEEVCELLTLGEASSGRKGRSERGHGLGPADRHAEEKRERFSMNVKTQEDI